MRLSAYVLAADPAWLVESIGAYYDLVDRLVVSYDADRLSWTGRTMPVDACLGLIESLDIAGKVVLVPGSYHRTDRRPLDNETAQRSEALSAAGEFGEWVLQLDTDEVITDPSTFVAALEEADSRGFAALDFPARNFYAALGDGSYLERSDRFWRPVSGFPGPTAVRSGTPLSLCRQVAAPRFRVDIRATNADPFQSWRVPVHRLVPTRSAIVHYSWVRDVETMRLKAASSGHAYEYDWSRLIDEWQRRAVRPWTTVFSTPLRRDRAARFRRSRLR